MDFEIRSATPAEQQYCYSQSTQIEGQAGCIGYLRADFGSGGDDFFASWFDSNREWKNPTFSNELDQLINTLRGFQTECLISGTAPRRRFWLAGRSFPIIVMRILKVRFKALLAKKSPSERILTSTHIFSD